MFGLSWATHISGHPFSRFPPYIGKNLPLRLDNRSGFYYNLSRVKNMKNVIGCGCVPGGKHILAKNKQQRVFGTAKVGDRGQIVIPKEARAFFGIQPGDTLLILGDAETGLIVSRPEVLHDLANEILGTIKNEE